jgi:phenylacetate-CoA ligase
MRTVPSTASSLRVCIVAPVPPPHGGMSIQAGKLAARLNSEGVETRVLSANPVFPAALRILERVPGARTVTRTLLYFQSVALGLPSGEVIHHMTVCGVYFFALTVPLIFWARLRGQRIVLNYRGGRAPAFLKRWSWVVIPIMRMANSVIVPSEFLQRTFNDHGLSTTVVPNIIDTAEFPYRVRESVSPKLIVTRHLEPVYNIECILRAFQIIKARFPLAELSIAGSGPEEQRLRQFSRNRKLEGVHFKGDVPAPELPALYAAHDIFVNSSNADNFPAALVEAACAGLPIVTTSAGGIPDMIRDGENGVLVGLNDHQALATAVIELVEDPHLARRLAASARGWAEQFSWPATFNSLLEHYGVTGFVAANCSYSVLGSSSSTLRSSKQEIASRDHS